MKDLLQTAKDHFDQVETFHSRNESINMQFQNSSLTSIDNDIQSALSMRVIKNNTLGFAYTRNLNSSEELIKNAENSMLGGVKAEYQFPHSPLVESLESYDPDIEAVNSNLMAEECQRISNYIKQKADAETEIYAGKDISSIEIINSNGTDLTHRDSTYWLYFTIVYPGSASGVSYCLMDKTFKKLDNEVLDRILSRYTAGKNIVHPESGEMQVLFVPGTMYALTWRLSIGASSRSFYDKITPISEKQGIRIFDEKLTFYTDPLDEEHPGCRPFDDEGVVCHRHNIIRNGIFEKRFNDLNYAAKLNERPTGHGIRSSITSLPSPSMHSLRLQPGHTSFNEMVKGMKRGIILEHMLGAHSGNLPNGDFSLGVSPGLYVENGKILGRLKEGMVTGNIYKMLKKVDAVEDSLHASGSNWMPSLLVDNVHVEI